MQVYLDQNGRILAELRLYVSSPHLPNLKLACRDGFSAGSCVWR